MPGLVIRTPPKPRMSPDVVGRVSNLHLHERTAAQATADAVPAAAAASSVPNAISRALVSKDDGQGCDATPSFGTSTTGVGVGVVDVASGAVE